MKISNLRRFSPGDYPDMPESFKRLLETLNDIFENLVVCLQNRTTFIDNFNCAEKTLELKHNTSVEIEMKQVKGRIREVQLVWSELYDYARVAWEFVTGSRIRVKVWWDSAPTDKVKVTLRFLGG
ncbi:MAG: hypothetical protein LUQ69_09735 [Methanoregulaceae archaeon]|jgi:hypothetical protein|nr:hypothetical protein [Methanoregulaceae archaeon]